MSTAELATSYAALILADDGVEITVSSDPDPRGEPRAENAWAANHPPRAAKR